MFHSLQTFVLPEMGLNGFSVWQRGQAEGSEPQLHGRHYKPHVRLHLPATLVHRRHMIRLLSFPSDASTCVFQTSGDNTSPLPVRIVQPTAVS